MINERGTQDLIGETIVMVDTSSINVIHLHCASGKVVSIDGEEQHYGIPIIAVNNWKD
jgi:hypothetical protein